MTLRCPSCGRPNAPEATKCIYCGQGLKPSPKQEAKEKLPEPVFEKLKPPQPPKNRLFLIISPRSEEPSETMIKELARIMRWDVYSARLRLKNPAPGILKVFEHSEEAQKLCQELNHLGIDAYLMKEQGLTQVQKKLIALSAEIQEHQISFQLEDQSQKALAFNELFLLVRGRVRLEGALAEKMGKVRIPEFTHESERLFDRLIQRRREKKKAKIEPGTLIRAEATEVELFDLYSRNSHQAIQVIENLFDFSGIFGPNFQARLLGIARLIELLKSRCPALLINENFNQVGYTYRERPAEKESLILAQPGKAQEKLHSAYALFTEYSGLVYLHYLRKTYPKAESSSSV